jgi:Spy/CpxP family protein refolding chaperone
MRPLVAAAMLIALAFCLSANALSSDPPRDREKIRERIEFMRMWKMLDVLDLDKATADKILDIRRKFIARKKSLRRALNEDFSKLRHLLRDTPQGPDNAELKRLLESIREQRKRLRALWSDQYEEVAKHLSIRKQAELLLFLKDFRREIRSMLRLPARHLPKASTNGKDRPRRPAEEPAAP